MATWDEIRTELAIARTAPNITQGALAEVIDSSTTSVSCWEHGRKHPSVHHLIAWADALGYDVTLTPREAS